jgi:hypothetical protein
MERETRRGFTCFVRRVSVVRGAWCVVRRTTGELPAPVRTQNARRTTQNGAALRRQAPVLFRGVDGTKLPWKPEKELPL